MKIAVVGDMNPTQQSVIDKMIADGHEIVYTGKDDNLNNPNGYKDYGVKLITSAETDIWYKHI